MGSTKHRDKDNEPEKKNRTSGTGSSDVLNSFAFPLIRRTFPELFSNKIVAVESMKGPVGLAYSLRFSYNPVPELSRLGEEEWYI